MVANSDGSLALGEVIIIEPSKAWSFQKWFAGLFSKFKLHDHRWIELGCEYGCADCDFAVAKNTKLGLSIGREIQQGRRDGIIS